MSAPQTITKTMTLALYLSCAALQAQDHMHGHDQGHQQHGEHEHEHEHAPPLTDADRAAAFPDLGDMHATDVMHRDRLRAFLLLDQLEVRDGDHGRDTHWDLKAWVGYDFHRMWIRSEGHRTSGDSTRGNVELLYGRAIAPWWDLLMGLRHDFADAGSRDALAAGVQGVTPYRFEVRATAYLGERGQVTARVKAEYEMHLTRRLVLQPLFKFSWYAHDDQPYGVAAGLSELEGGLRLRYEWRRYVAPYVGVHRQVYRGGTAELVRGTGRPSRDTQLVAGVRFWL
jgi:copper resistance protein B